MAIAVQPAGAEGRAHDRFEPLDIAIDRCKGCGLCVSICPKAVLELDNSIVNERGYHPVRLIDAAACTSCARAPDLPRHRVHRVRAAEAVLTWPPSRTHQRTPVVGMAAPGRS